MTAAKPSAAAPATPVETASPERFGKYWLDAQLAEGGMSRVHRARLRGPGGFEKKLVVKQILPRLAQDPSFIELFVREANTLVQMSHPNIVPVYELGVVDGVYFLAMELVDGATIAEVLREGTLPEALCAQIGVQVCEALHYAHERFGVVHRDVTPRNVIIDAGGHVRLLDFGIAAPFAHASSGELFGSAGYMSPEQARGDALGPQSDLFSLGTVLYEALTARPALAQPKLHDAASTSTAMPAQLGGGDGVSPELAKLVNQLLALDARDRPGSAAEVASRLRTWLAQKHPDGVARELGRRADRARAQADAPKPQAISQSPSRSQPPPAGTSPLTSAGVTRSIATSPQLAQLLYAGTEPLERARPLTQPPSSAGKRLRWLLWPGLLALTAAALFMLQPREQAPIAAAEPASNQTAPSVGGSASALHGDPAFAVPRATQATASATAVASADSPADAGARTSPLSAVGALPTRAHLSVNALPWAELRLDGRPIGATPKRALSISPGAHVLQLDCPPLGRSTKIPFKLDAGDQKHVVVDMNANPPRITQ